MIEIDTTLCWKTWGFGMVISLPSKSREFYLNTKTRSFLAIWLYLGPLTIEASKPREIIAFVCASCQDTHTGEPALSAPLPGAVFCEDCLEQGRPGMVMLSDE